MVFSINILTKPRLKGFTLLEMLIVIAVFGLVLIAGGSSYINSQRRARDAKRKTDIETLRQALELYRSTNSAYPDTGADADANGSMRTTFLTTTTYGGPFLNNSSYPKDPYYTSLGRIYYYQINPSGSGVNTYALCVYLETFTAGVDPACSLAAVNCGGGQNCNYGLTEP